MTRTLVLAAAFCLSFSATAQVEAPTSLYTEIGGTTGLYAVGVDLEVLSSRDDNRRLSLRVGAAYFVDQRFIDWKERVFALPVGGLASFSLGRALGASLAFETGGGATFSYQTFDALELEDGTFFSEGTSIVTRPYLEAAVRVAVTDHVDVRGGFVAGGGTNAPRSIDASQFVIGVGYSL